MSSSNNDRRLQLPESVRYAFVVLLVLLVAPAFLHGMMAFFRAFAQTLEVTIMALGLAGGGFWVWQRDRRQQQGWEAMQGTLDRYLQEGKPFKLGDFAEKVGLPATTVKPYLERVSRERNTLVEVDDRGTIYYYVKLPDAPIEPEYPTSAEIDRGSDSHRESRPLIQAELARRLQVSASTIGKRKLKPDFTDWARSKDPEGMGWRYSQVTKQFYPQP
ncbi:MAG TPA: hypothetical protein IGS17_13385 [Oscillatoriales cyanobacterium M59_W2019_021]|nr:MAG: hypothetical protein D6728_17505 [Cyanobacteria bacterium J055]HIK30712.1 hypothetical protein [Oscillatoriales cyanobacterium M4454_W2019_049]HIK51898.1 hypothetical protein [Oscillatoriales cyanobacterium M59_W2019_021]